MKTRINLFLVSSFIVTLAVLSSTLMFLGQMRTEALQLAATEQEQAIRTFWQLLLAKGSDFRVVDGKMMVGGYLVNENYELPDKIREIFGGTATIFMGDTRVSTNVLKEDGTRAVGTRLTGPAYDAIFRENRPYRGEAPILDIPYFTAYDPIRDRSGTTIGALYVGVKKSEFLTGYARLKARIIAGTSLLGIFLVALSWGLLRVRGGAENRIREMADRIRLITDAVPVGIAYVDTGMRYLFANRRYAQLFGTAGGMHLVGKQVSEVVGDAFFASRHEKIRQAVAGDEVMFTHEVTRRDGSILILQTAYIPHRVDAGTVVGYFIQHYDITDLTLAQEALRESEEQYRTLFNTTGAATFVCEEDTTVALVNQEFCRLYDYSREEVEGKMSWTNFIVGEHRERMLGYHESRRIDPASAPREYECDAMRRDGSVRNILVYAGIIPGTRRSIISFLDITERKRLDSALQQQLSFLQTLIDTIPSPIFYKDRAGRYLGCNLAFESYLGLAREELVGKSVYEIAPQDLADRYFEMDETLFTSPGVQVYDASVVYADGSRRDVIFSKATFPDQNGRVAGLVGVILDLTERNRSERLLLGEKTVLEMIVSEAPLVDVLEQLCRNVESNVPGALCSVMLMDGSGIRLSGLPADDGHGDATAFAHKPGTNGDIALDPLWEKYRALPLRYGMQPSQSMPIRSTSGITLGTFAVYYPSPETPSPAELHVVERAAHLASIVIDRNRAEMELRASEERFHQIFAQSDDAIILFRLDTFAIIDANPAAQELFGLSHAELVSRMPCMLISQKDFAALIDAIPQSDAAAFQLDRAEGIRSDGSRVMIVVRCRILRLRDEYVIHCSVRDITAKVRLEEEVRSTQARLIHTNKMTSIGMLASSVAHEINNPNNCISVNAGMLADIWQDAAPLLGRHHDEHGEFDLRGIPFAQMRDIAPRLLNGITEGSRRITAIVNSMKDFVREDKSGLHGVIDINRLVRNAATILWHHIHVHTDHFDMALQDPLPAARGNGQQIEQVIINLFMNALQALPDKQAAVRVTTSCDPKAGTVTITVRDEGAGMDESVMARLKEPFFTTKIAEGGTGLGLYISDSILREHSGSLAFDSVPGTGTTATVTLLMAGVPS